jgi:hypothetical protein
LDWAETAADAQGLAPQGSESPGFLDLVRRDLVMEGERLAAVPRRAPMDILTGEGAAGGTDEVATEVLSLFGLIDTVTGLIHPLQAPLTTSRAYRVGDVARPPYRLFSTPPWQSPAPDGRTGELPSAPVGERPDENSARGGVVS